MYFAINYTPLFHFLVCAACGIPERNRLVLFKFYSLFFSPLRQIAKAPWRQFWLFDFAWKFQLYHAEPSSRMGDLNWGWRWRWNVISSRWKLSILSNYCLWFQLLWGSDLFPGAFFFFFRFIESGEPVSWSILSTQIASYPAVIQTRLLGFVSQERIERIRREEGMFGNYNERQKKLITSLERHLLKSKALRWIIIGHRLAIVVLTNHISKNKRLLESKKSKIRWIRKRSFFKNHRICSPPVHGARHGQ